MKISIVTNSAWAAYNFRVNLANAFISEGNEVVFIIPFDNNYSNKLKKQFNCHQLFIDPKSLDINKIKSAIKFIKWSNQSDDYFMVYGMILQLDHKFNEAIDIFKKVYGKTDRNGAIRLIADSYFNLKEYENALSYYNKYFTFDLRDKSIVDSMISSCHTLIKLQKS